MYIVVSETLCNLFKIYHHFHGLFYIWEDVRNAPSSGSPEKIAVGKGIYSPVPPISSCLSYQIINCRCERAIHNEVRP